MQFLYFILIVVVSTAIYIPIQKKHKWNKRYKIKDNRPFRIIVVTIGMIGVAGELCIGFSGLDATSLLRKSLEILFGIPILFTLLVANPLVNDEE